jgi:hypothetical protein
VRHCSRRVAPCQCVETLDTAPCLSSHYSAPELAELIRAANAVLKAQESTLLRVVTKQLQVVSGETRAKVAQTGISAETGQERKLLTR